MKNNKKYNLKAKTKLLFAISSLSTLLVGCSKNDIEAFKNIPFNYENTTSDDVENEITIIVNTLPDTRSIPSQYSNVENYYKYKIKNDEAIKYYNSNNVYILFDRKTYEISEFIYADSEVCTLGFVTTSIELYDLTTEQMLVFDNGMGTYYNLDYYDTIRENNYQVCLNEIEDYIEGEQLQEYYTLEEIRKLEFQILNSLKIINDEKVLNKKRSFN